MIAELLFIWAVVAPGAKAPAEVPVATAAPAPTAPAASVPVAAAVPAPREPAPRESIPPPNFILFLGLIWGLGAAGLSYATVALVDFLAGLLKSAPLKTALEERPFSCPLCMSLWATAVLSTSWWFFSGLSASAPTVLWWLSASLIAVGPALLTQKLVLWLSRD